MTHCRSLLLFSRLPQFPVPMLKWQSLKSKYSWLGTFRAVDITSRLGVRISGIVRHSFMHGDHPNSRQVEDLIGDRITDSILTEFPDNGYSIIFSQPSCVSSGFKWGFLKISYVLSDCRVSLESGWSINLILPG